MPMDRHANVIQFSVTGCLPSPSPVSCRGHDEDVKIKFIITAVDGIAENIAPYL